MTKPPAFRAAVRALSSIPAGAWAIPGSAVRNPSVRTNAASIRLEETSIKTFSFIKLSVIAPCGTSKNRAHCTLSSRVPGHRHLYRRRISKNFSVKHQSKLSLLTSYALNVLNSTRSNATFYQQPGSRPQHVYVLLYVYVYARAAGAGRS